MPGQADEYAADGSGGQRCTGTGGDGDDDGKRESNAGDCRLYSERGKRHGRGDPGALEEAGAVTTVNHPVRPAH